MFTELWIKIESFIEQPSDIATSWAWLPLRFEEVNSLVSAASDDGCWSSEQPCYCWQRCSLFCKDIALATSNACSLLKTIALLWPAAMLVIGKGNSLGIAGRDTCCYSRQRSWLAAMLVVGENNSVGYQRCLFVVKTTTFVKPVAMLVVDKQSNLGMAGSNDVCWSIQRLWNSRPNIPKSGPGGILWPQGTQEASIFISQGRAASCDHSAFKKPQ